jgi:hemerythrin-like domain-containing protein
MGPTLSWAPTVSSKGEAVEPIEVLRREHSMVKLVLDAASRDLDQMATTRAADVAELEQLIDFFHYFADACHDPKEEDLLFCMLHRRGMSWETWPLDELLKEHEEMRVMLESVADWLPLLRHGETAALEPLTHNLRAYLSLANAHIEKEEDLVFPLALRYLTSADVEELSRAFDSIEEEESFPEYYADLAQRLARSTSL